MFYSDIQYFEDVLKVYEHLTNLHFIITDKDGEIIVNPERIGDQNLFEVLYDDETGEELLRKWSREFSNISRPILFDAFPGIKSLVTPIAHQGKTEQFLFAGFLLEMSSKKNIELYLESKGVLSKEVINTLDNLNEYSRDEIQEKINKIRKLSNIFAERLATQKLKNGLQEQEKVLNNFLQLVSADEVDMTDLLRWFYNVYSNVDFICYARKKNQDVYIVEECFSDNNDSLEGTEFLLGEGILGQAAVSHLETFCNNADWDPRNIFFHNHGIYPKSIFCFPIIQEQEVIGLFWGGSCEANQTEKEIQRNGKLLASFIKKIESKNYWKNKANSGAVKLDSFYELLESLRAAQDVKGIQMLIMKISINLLHGPCAAFIWKQATGESYDMVTSGLTTDQIEKYSEDITERYFNNKQWLNETNHEPIRYVKNCDMNILEIPMVYNNVCYGLLTLGLGELPVTEEDISFLKNITIAGGIAILMLEAKNRTQTEKQEISDPDEPSIRHQLRLSKREMEVINHVIKGSNNREIAGNLFISEHTVKNHMTNIFQKLSVSDRSQLIAKIYQTGFLSEDA